MVDEQIQPRVVIDAQFYNRLELLCPGSLTRPETLRYYVNLGYMAQLGVIGADNPGDVLAMEISMADDIGDEDREEWAMESIKTLMRMQGLESVDIDDLDD